VKNVMFISGHNQDREPATVIFVKVTNKSKLRSWRNEGQIEFRESLPPFGGESLSCRFIYVICYPCVIWAAAGLCHQRKKKKKNCGISWLNEEQQLIRQRSTHWRQLLTLEHWRRRRSVPAKPADYTA